VRITSLGVEAWRHPRPALRLHVRRALDAWAWPAADPDRGRRPLSRGSAQPGGGTTPSGQRTSSVGRASMTAGCGR